jgi:hypothetical protein
MLIILSFQISVFLQHLSGYKMRDQRFFPGEAIKAFLLQALPGFFPSDVSSLLPYKFIRPEPETSIAFITNDESMF